MSRREPRVCVTLVGFSLLFLAAAPAPARAAGKDARLTITPTQSIVSSTKGARARVSLKAVDEEGKPRRGLTYLGETSFGSLSPVKESAPGEYVATLHLPPTDMPRVALVVFSPQETQETDVAFSAVPVTVQAVLGASTEPRSRVSARVDGVTFGPVIADRSGRFVIELLQPPGTRSATIVARDPAGNVQEHVLNVPQREHDPLTVTLDRYRVTSDGSEQVRVFAFAFTKEGRAIRGAKLGASASAGRLSAFVDHGDGVYTAVWQAPRSGDKGTAKIDVSLSHAGRRHSEVERVSYVQGLPASLTLAADSTELIVGETQEVALLAQTFDSAGNPLPNEPVTMHADRGTLGPVVDQGNGNYTSSLAIPQDTGSGSIEVKALLTVGQADASASSLDIKANPKVLPTSWRAFSLVTVAVADEAGAPLPGEVVLFSIAEGEGTITPAAVTNREGRAFADFSANPKAEVVTVQATATSRPSLQAQTTIEKQDSGAFAIINRPAVAAQGGSGPGTLVIDDTHRVLQASVLLQVHPGDPARLLAHAEPSTLVADGESVSRVTASLHDAIGNGIPEQELTFTTEVGTLSDVSDMGDGRYIASYTAPEGRGDGQAIIAVAHAESGLTASTTIELTVGPPATLTLASDVTELPADGRSQALLTATVLDASGSPIPDLAVTLTVSGAEASLAANAPTNQSGTTEALLTAGEMDGVTTVRAALSGVEPAEVSLDLLPIRAAVIALTANPAFLPADGVTRSELEASLESFRGEPVVGQAVRFSTTGSRSTLLEEVVVSDFNGVARTSLTSDESGTVQVRAELVDEASLYAEADIKVDAVVQAHFTVESPCAGQVRLLAWDGTAARYSWDWTGDGIADATGSSATPPLGAGFHTVALTVEDDDGNTNTASQSVTVAAAPTAVITASAPQAPAGDCVTLSAVDSVVAGPGAARYDWSFAGGATANEREAEFCGAPGHQRAVLTVTSEDGCSAMSETVILFGDTPALGVSLALVGQAPVPVDEVVDLRVSWRNDGPATARAAWLELALSPFLSLEGSVPPGGTAVGARRLRFPMGDLASGASGQFTVPVRTAAGADLVTTPVAATSTLDMSCASRTGGLGPVTDVATFNIVDPVDLALTLASSAPPAVGAGEDLDVSLKVTNLSGRSAEDVILTLSWDPSLLGGLTSPASGGAGGSASLSLNSMGQGETRVVPLTFAVPCPLPQATNDLALRARLTHGGTDLNPGNDQVDVTSVATASADVWVRLESTASEVPALAGSRIDYQLQVGNRGCVAASAVTARASFASDIFASSLLSNSDSGVFSASSGTMDWSFGQVAAEPGGAAAVTPSYAVRVHSTAPDDHTEIRTVIDLAHDAADADATNDRAVDSLPLVAQPSLTLGLSAAASADAGDLVTYTLTTTGSGSGTARDVEVDVVMSGALSTLSLPDLPAGAHATAEGLRLANFDVSGGSSVIHRWKVRVSDPQTQSQPTLLTRVTATFGSDPGAGDQRANHGLTVRTEPVAVLSVTLEPRDPGPGDAVLASVSLTSSGSEPQPSGTLDWDWPLDLVSGASSSPGSFPQVPSGDTLVVGTWSATLANVMPADDNELRVATWISGEPGSRAEDTVHVSAAPVLTAALVSPPDRAAPGESLDLEVLVANTGSLDARGVQVRLDEVGPDYFSSITPAFVTLGDLSAGAAGLSANFRATVVATLPSCLQDTSLQPTVTRSGDAGLVKGTLSPIVVGAAPDLELSLSAHPAGGQAQASGTVDYRITVTNRGNAPALSPSIELRRDAALLPAVLPPLPAGATPTGPDTLDIDLPDLDPGDSADRTVSLWIVDVLPATENHALVTATVTEAEDCESAPSDNTSTHSLPITGSADLAVDLISTAPSPLGAADQIELTVVLTNLGNTAALDSEVRLAHPDATLVESLSGSDFGPGAGTELAWVVGALAAGDSLMSELTITLPSSLPATSNDLRFTARAQTSTPDSDGSNDEDELSLEATASADLCVSVTPAAWPYPPAPDGDLRYDVSVENLGTTGSGLISLSLSYDETLLDPDGDSPITWTVPELLPGDAAVTRSIDFTIDSTLPTTREVISTLVEASSANHQDADACPTTVTVDTVVTTEPDLSVALRIVPPPMAPQLGSAVTVNVDVVNLGATSAVDPASSLEVTIPDECTVPSPPSGSALMADRLVWADLLDNVAPGEVLPVSFEMHLRDDLANGSYLLESEATITNISDLNPGNDTASDSLAVELNPDLQVTLSCPSAGPHDASEVLDFEARTDNLGAYAASGVSLLAQTTGPALINDVSLPTRTKVFPLLTNLAPGGDWSQPFQAVMDAEFPNELNNVSVSAEVSATELAAPATGSCDFSVRASVDLRVQVRSGLPAPHDPGTVVPFSVDLTNVGSLIESGVQLNMSFDPTLATHVGTTFTEVSPGTLTLDLAQLAPSEGTLSFALPLQLATSLPTVDTVLRLCATATSTHPDAFPADNLSCMDQLIRAAPDLALTVSLAAGGACASPPFVPGDDVCYDMSVQNLGSAPATEVVLSVSRSALTTGVAFADTAYTEAGNDVLFALPDLAVSGAEAVSFQLRLGAEMPSIDESLFTAACALLAENDETPPDNCDDVTSPVFAAPDAWTQLVLDPAADLAPGQPFTAQVSYGNLGSSPVVAPTVRLDLPASVVVVDSAGGVPSGSSLDYAGLADLPPGASENFVVQLQVNDTFPATSNELTFRSDILHADTLRETNAGNNISSVNITVEASHDLVVTLTRLTAAPVSGGLVEYEASWENLGSTAVVASLDVTTGAPLLVEPGVEPNALTKTYPLGNVLPGVGNGGSQTLAWRLPSCLPATGGDVSVTASVTPSDGTPSNNTATDLHSLAGTPDLALSMVAGPRPAGAGTLMTMIVTVQNIGQAVAGGTTLSFFYAADLVKDNFLWGGLTPTAWDKVAGTASFDLGDIPCQGTPTSYFFQVSAIDVLPEPTGPSANAFSVGASVDATNEPPSLTWNNVASTVNHLEAAPDLAATLEYHEEPPPPAGAGSVLNFTAGLRNIGTTRAENTVLTATWDVAPDVLIASVNDAGGGIIAGNQITWNLGTLAAGAAGPTTRDFSLVAADSFPAIANVQIVRALGATSDSESGIGPNEATVDVDLEGWVDLVLTQATVVPATNAGVNTLLTYEYTYENQGSAPAEEPCLFVPFDATRVSKEPGSDGTPLGSELSFCDLAPLVPGAPAWTKTALFRVLPRPVPPVVQLIPGTPPARVEEGTHGLTRERPADQGNNSAGVDVIACFMDSSVRATGLTSICNGSSLSLIGESNFEGALTYAWSSDDGLGSFNDASLSTTTYTPPPLSGGANESHVVRLTVTDPLSGCTSESTITVTVRQDCDGCGCGDNRNLRWWYIPDSLSRKSDPGNDHPVVEQGEDVSFEVCVESWTNGGGNSPPAATIKAGLTTFSFSAGGATYLSALAEDVHAECETEVCLLFPTATMPANMPPGNHDHSGVISIHAVDACGDTETGSTHTDKDHIVVIEPTGMNLEPIIEITDWGPAGVVRPAPSGR